MIWLVLGPEIPSAPLYPLLVAALREAGFAAAAVHPRGTGYSPGPRGHLDDHRRFLADHRAYAEALAMQQDPLVVRSFSLRMLAAQREVMDRCAGNAARTTAPLLLVQGARDALVDPGGNDEILAASAAGDRRPAKARGRPGRSRLQRRGDDGGAAAGVAGGARAGERSAAVAPASPVQGNSDQGVPGRLRRATSQVHRSTKGRGHHEGLSGLA